MRPGKSDIGELAQEVVAIVVALLVFAGEADVDATAAHTIRVIATREKLDAAEALSLAKAVDMSVAGVATRRAKQPDCVSVTALAVMPVAGSA